MKYSLPKSRLAACSAILVSFAIAGCCKEKHTDVWIPRPRVHWEHVCTDPVRPVFDGYRILTPEPTRGLFPASIGVTRLAVQTMDPHAQTTQPAMLTDPRNEFLQWNRAFDNLMAISEVFPIVERDLGGCEADPPQIIAATRALHARLSLVYAFNELSSSEAEMLGVLYDTTTAQPVASIHASAVSVVPPKEDEDDDAPDPWETDAHALVRKKFERRVHACIREMIRQDESVAVEAPIGWTPAGPIRPVEWPPRHFRTGRP